MPNTPSSNSATAQGVTGRCENPKHAPTSATAPTNPATPTPTEKNSKTISASPATKRKYATHGEFKVCASWATRPSLRKWISPFGSRTWLPFNSTTLIVESFTGPDEVWIVRPVEQPDELEQRGRLRGHVLQRSVHLERRVVVPDGIDRADVRAGATRRTRPSAAAPAPGRRSALRPYPHGDGYRCMGHVVQQLVDVDVDGARRVELEHDGGRVRPLRVAKRRTDERGVGRIDQAVDLYDVDAPVAHGLRGRDRAERRSVERQRAERRRDQRAAAQAHQ